MYTYIHTYIYIYICIDICIVMKCRYFPQSTFTGKPGRMWQDAANCIGVCGKVCALNTAHGKLYGICGKSVEAPFQTACWILHLLLLVICPAILPNPKNTTCNRQPNNREHNPRPTPPNQPKATISYGLGLCGLRFVRVCIYIYTYIYIYINIYIYIYIYTQRAGRPD